MHVIAEDQGSGRLMDTDTPQNQDPAQPALPRLSAT
jgi:hypothetical protein